MDCLLLVLAHVRADNSGDGLLKVGGSPRGDDARVFIGSVLPYLSTGDHRKGACGVLARLPSHGLNHLPHSIVVGHGFPVEEPRASGGHDTDRRVLPTVGVVERPIIREC